MTEDKFRAEKKYQAVMAIARRMLREGKISTEEYRQFDTKMTGKYRPTFGTLFAEKT